MSANATEILHAMRHGDPKAAEALLPLVYEELRQLAERSFRRQRAGHTLQATALAHEAWMRLIDQTSVAYNDRRHFFAVAATAMRQILTDHARRVGAAKRGGDLARFALEDADGAIAGDDAHALDMLALDAALTRLAALDERKHRVVELRFFGGLSMDDIAETMGVSKRTVESDWRGARAWLLRELQ
jgi:RNA polymerase sigma factor (TIGR02999 family)